MSAPVCRRAAHYRSHQDLTSHLRRPRILRSLRCRRWFVFTKSCRAVAGVRRLAQLGEVRYATARKPEVEQITRAWLTQQGFPFPEHALFCTGVAEKLVALASFPGLVLVDDRWQQLLTLLEQYGQRLVLQGLCERLTLVAFGAVKVPESSVVPLLPLPDWSRLEELLLSNSFTEVFVSSSQIRKDFS